MRPFGASFYFQLNQVHSPQVVLLGGNAMFRGIKYRKHRLNERGILLHTLLGLVGEYCEVDLKAVPEGVKITRIPIHFRGQDTKVQCHASSMPHVSWAHRSVPHEQRQRINVEMMSPGLLLYALTGAKIVCYVVHDDSEQIVGEAELIMTEQHSRHILTYPV